MVEHYKIEKKCWNCGTDNYLSIPKGTTLEEYLDAKPCGNCGCNMRLKD